MAQRPLETGLLGQHRTVRYRTDSELQGSYRRLCPMGSSEIRSSGGAPLRPRSAEAMVVKYYHVIKRANAWEVYANDATAPLASDPSQAEALKKARSIARYKPGRIVLHRACEDPRE